MLLQDIYVYPVKSLGGIRLDSAMLEGRGLKWDRRWMLVDKDGRFLTQRKHHQMALLQVELGEHYLLVYNKHDKTQITEIPLSPETDRFITTEIWEDKVVGQVVSESVSTWFSAQLGIDCDLVYMPDTTERKLDEKYAVNGESVSFADAMPYLIIGQSSLDDLNGKLEQPVPMNRFRPNLVFCGGASFVEDNWKEIKIGESLFKVTKPCARCVLTTVDQLTGQKGKEPLNTLAQYRTKDKKVMFGQNLLLLNGDIIKTGDLVRGF